MGTNNTKLRGCLLNIDMLCDQMLTHPQTEASMQMQRRELTQMCQLAIRLGVDGLGFSLMCQGWLDASSVGNEWLMRMVLEPLGRTARGLVDGVSAAAVG